MREEMQECGSDGCCGCVGAGDDLEYDFGFNLPLRDAVADECSEL